MSKKRATQSHDFTQVAKQIPTLIFEEIRRNELSLESTQTEQKIAEPAEKKRRAPSIYQSPAHSRRWMLIGVILTSICILLFWFLYISQLIHENKPTLNPASSLTGSGNNDIPMIISTFNKMEADLKGNIKSPSELKAMVAGALAPLFAHGSTSTPTATSTGTATTTEHSLSSTSTPTP